MKRQRSNFVEEETEVVTHLAETNPLALGPLAHPSASGLALWLDFWWESLKYLPPKTLYHMSCCSRALNQLIWDRLIPEKGLKFYDTVAKLPALSKYLTRVPSLRSLDLEDYEALAPLLQVLPKITQISNLSNLCLPNSPLGPPGGSAWNPSLLTHMTDLTGLRADVSIGSKTKKIGAWIGEFTKLKNLAVTIHRVCKQNKELYDFLQPLTRLETLEWAREDIVHDLSKHLRLRELKVDSIDRYVLLDLDLSRPLVGFGLDCLTNLTRLDLSPARSTDVTGLTNLTRLKMQVGQPGYLKELTKLTRLDFGTEDRSYAVDLPNFMHLETLTNLTHLVISQTYLFPQVVDMLAVLPQLTCLNVRWYHDLDHDEALASAFLWRLTRLTRLTKLVIHRPSEDLMMLTVLTNLKSLNFDTKRFHWVSRLTSLENLHYRTLWCSMNNQVQANSFSYLRPLTNLKTLTLPCRSEVDIILRTLGVMSSLKKLFLPKSEISAKAIQLIAQNLNQLVHLDLSDSIPRLDFDSLEPLLGLNLEIFKFNQNRWVDQCHFWDTVNSTRSTAREHKLAK